MQELVRRYIDKILRRCSLSRTDADGWESQRLEQIESALTSIIAGILSRKNKKR